MKKIISVMLVIAMILSLCLPALATESATDAILVGEGQTNISSDKYISYEGVGSLKPMYTTNSFTYRLNFSNPGHYRLSIRNLNFNDTTLDTVARISVDDKVVGSGIIPKKAVPGQANSTQETYICSFDVDSGEKLITVYNAGAAFYFYELILEHVDVRLEYDIFGNDYTAISSTGVTDNQPATGMSPNAYAEYDFTADCHGTYGIYATVAAELGTAGEVSASVGGALAGKGSFEGKDWFEFDEIYVGSVSLKEGEHTLRMTSGATMRLSEIRVKVVPQATEEDFLAALQNAGSASSLQKVFQEYNDSMIIPYDDCLNGIFYRRLVEEELLKTTYDSLVEFDSLFLTIYNEEKNNPLVTLTQNGENVTTLQNGEFTVTIAPRFMEELKAIAAIYTEDGMTLVDSKMVDIKPYEQTTITGISATDDGKLLKVFFIKDTETLRPMELPLIQSRIYVATDGKDSAAGTASQPFKTLDKAIERTKELNAVHPRDVVIYLAGGEYVIEDTIELDESFSGRDDCGVHFISLTPSNPAVISGGYDVPEWSDTDGDGIYTAQLPNTITDVRQLYIDEEPAQRARGDYLFRASSRWDDPDTTYEEDGFVVKNSQFPELIKPKDVEIVYPILWTVQRLPLESITYDETADEYTIKMDQPYYSTAITMICGGGVQPRIGQRFYFENDLSLLDEFGEFYFDKDTKVIYYKPFAEEDMSKVRAVIGKTENLLLVKGANEGKKVKNISFSDISFRYGGYYTEINREGAVSFQAENLVDAESGLNQNPVASVNGGRTLDAQIVFENAQNISFENCDISCMGSTGLRLGKGVTDSYVTGCTFSNNGGGAVTVGSWKSADALAQNVALANNVIYNQGIDFMFCPAVSIYYAKDIDVLHNTICKTPYSGISINWGWESETPKNLGCGGHNISYNRIYDISNSVVDGGHIYNVGYMEDVLISNNYLSDSEDLGGIYFDTGSKGATVTGNVVETTQYWLFGGPDADNNKVYDNYSDTGAMRYSGVQTSDYFEEAIIRKDSWPSKAQAVINQAGVQEDYLDKLDIVSKPAWRTVEHFERPVIEARDPSEIYVEAKDYSDFYIKTSDSDNKTEPALFTYSGITGVGDFRQGEWLEYTFDVDVAGTYTLDFYYTTGPETDAAAGKIDIFLNSIYYLVPNFDDFSLSPTGTEWTAYVPVTAGSVTLKKGTNTLRIKNVGTSFGFCGFNFVPISETN